MSLDEYVIFQLCRCGQSRVESGVRRARYHDAIDSEYKTSRFHLFNASSLTLKMVSQVPPDSTCFSEIQSLGVSVEPNRSYVFETIWLSNTDQARVLLLHETRAMWTTPSESTSRRATGKNPRSPRHDTWKAPRLGGEPSG